METAIFIYEPGQVSALKGFLSKVPDKERASHAVIALGADVEMVLEENGISFISGKGLRSIEHIDFTTSVEKIGREVLEDPNFSFLSYRDVYLPKVFRPVLQYYLLFILYYIDVFTTFAETNPHYKQIVVLPSTQIPPEETSGMLALLGVASPINAALFVSKRFGFEVVIPALGKLQTPTERFRLRMELMMFNMKRTVFGWALFILNTFITLGVPKKQIRVLVSDNWKNISSLMPELPEAEVLLLDRAEVFKAGFAAAWKNRMRFVHLEDFVSRPMQRKELQQLDAFITQWKQAQDKNGVLQEAEFRGNKIAPILEAALQEIVTKGARRAVRMIDGAYALCEHMRPDIVLVRASVSGQIHFPILCYVARQLGIPSLEIQHGIFYVGQGSFFDHPAAEYVATYGHLASEGLKGVGYTDQRLFDIGSPRFDAYPVMRERTAGKTRSDKPFTIVCMVPEVLPQSWSDTYEIVDFFSNVAAAVADIDDVLIIFKIRPSAFNEDFYRKTAAKALGAIPYRIAQYEPLIDVIAESDVVVTIYSTTLLEGLISGRPTIYNGTLKMHDAIGKEFIPYADTGALAKVKTRDELTEALGSLAHDPGRRASQVEKADVFMRQNYSFEGSASKRLAECIRSLTAHDRK